MVAKMQNVDITSKAKSGLKWTVILRFSSQIFTWIISFLVIRFIAPEDYSTVSLAEVFFSSLFIICTLGLHEAAIQSKSFSETLLKKVLGLMLVIHLVVSLFLWGLADYIAILYKNPDLALVLKAGAVVYIITPWLNTAFASLSRAMEFKRRGFVDLYSAILTSFASLILAWLGFGFWALIGANFINIILRAIGYNYLLGKLYLPSFDFSGMSTLIKFGLTVVGAGFLSSLYVGADVVVAGWSIKPEVLGSYAMAMFLAIMPMAKLMPLLYDVVFPYFSAIRVEEKCIEIFNKIITLVSFYIFPIFFAGVVIIEDLVILLLGEQWQAAVVPMQFVLITIPLRMVVNLLWPMVRALGYSSIVMHHTAISLLLVAVIVFVVTPFGIDAIAASWCFTTPVLFISAVIMVNRHIRLSLISVLSLMYRPVIISTVSLFCCLWVDSRFSAEVSLFTASVLLLIFISIYMLLSALFNREKMLYALSFRL
jgi:O-antigen/teichoic acid export membrane protein